VIDRPTHTQQVVAFVARGQAEARFERLAGERLDRDGDTRGRDVASPRASAFAALREPSGRFVGGCRGCGGRNP
jgi:hypothetical protein